MPFGTRRVAVPLVLGAFALAACDDNSPSMLDTKGPGAAHAESLWWPMLWIATVVFVIVCVMLALAALRARRSDDKLDRSEVSWGERFIVIAGVVVPALILSAMFLLTLKEMRALAETDDDARMTIEVIGHDWWWEVRYPNGAVTANEIHIPAGEPIRVELSTADVIHSFWVPQLQVKTDQIPGITHETWLEADEPGRYRGQCAEFCGLQHTKMAFFVVAQPPDEFDAWVEHEAEPATPSDSEGEAVFMGSSCVGCHTIRGTDARATDGPDLTHLMTRDIIGGFFENTEANLRQFVRDPHEIKHGVFMPPSDIDDSDLDALIEYLANLD